MKPKARMNLLSEKIAKVIDHTLAGIGEAREAFHPELSPQETGVIQSVASGIATVTGLPGTGYEELLRFPGDLLGMAYNLEEEKIGTVLLGESVHLNAGDSVARTGRVMDVPVGDALLGRVVDPLGRPLDEKGPLNASQRLPIERPAPSIMDRDPVTVPMQTGIKVIDALIPLGRGQRELILGDRQTGKTAIAINTMLNQHDKDVICIYCSIGQRASSVARVIATLQSHGAMDYSIGVVTRGNDPPGLVYLAPYAATSMAEYFMERGKDVLIVYDDLTHHARAYRELSLLLRRPPGREAFPGDIFYIHARLLERATHLNDRRGGGSLTALPIVETEAQNISAYIPTNLISITDGQVFLSRKLFELGVLPAVDVGKSVSRVGGKAQHQAYRSVAGMLKLAYSQFEELEVFARFGTRLDEPTKKIIAHGQRIRACLQQQELEAVSLPQQIMVLFALAHGLFDEVPLPDMRKAELALRNTVDRLSEDQVQLIFSADTLDESGRKELLQIAGEALRPFYTRNPKKDHEQHP